jgi:hypothetical protein
MIAGPSAEIRLRDKLRKIEALFAGAATPGEKAAADAAADRANVRFAAKSRFHLRAGGSATQSFGQLRTGWGDL